MIDNKDQNNIDVNLKSVNDKIKKKESVECDAAIESIIDPQVEQINQLKNKLYQLEERERDTVLRLTAEIDNIRRRNIQEIEKIHKFSLERFILDLLPVIDNLERTLSIVDRSKIEFKAIIEGIDLTLKSFLDTVHKYGVESIHAVDVPFNPEIHQAISTVNSQEHEPNKVLTIIQKGYILNGRLMRPAMVIVSQVKS